MATLILYAGLNLTPTYEHSYIFRDRNEQETFFQGLQNFITFEKYSYIKNYDGSGKIRVGIGADSLEIYSYGRYFNEENDNWVYFFIESIEYVAEETSIINFTIDVFTTYMFDYIINPSYCLRGHTNEKNLFSNLVNDNLSTGGFVTTHYNQKTFTNGFRYCLFVTEVYGPNYVFNTASDVYYNIPVGGRVITPVTNDVEGLRELIRIYAENGKSDAIIALYIVPNDVLNVGGVTFLGHEYDNVNPKTLDEMPKYTIELYPQIDGYIPKNNKLFSEPFYQYVITNNKGNSVIWDVSKFASGNITYEMIGTILPNGKCVLVPTNYDNIIENFDNSIIVFNNIQGVLNKDFYLNWSATQDIKNDYTIAQANINTAMGLTTALTEGATMNVDSAFKTTATTIINYNSVLQNIKMNNEIAEIVPNTVSGTVTNDIESFFASVGYYGEFKTIRRNVAESIDDFFSMYGYPIKKIIKLDLFSRRSWNYVKYNGVTAVNLGIPCNFFDKILSIYNNGITLWHTKNIGDYSLENDIV